MTPDPDSPTPDAPPVPDVPPALDPRHLRNALGRFTTGVTIITCLDEHQQPVGLTANSFSALSLAPPLVLWSLRRASASLPAFLAAGQFAINVLAQDQLEISRRFASSAADKFDHGRWSPGLHDLPVLGECAALFECVTVGYQDAGDHVLFIGQVERATETDTPPLVYQAGRYHGLGNVL